MFVVFVEEEQLEVFNITHVEFRTVAVTVMLDTDSEDLKVHT